MSQSDSFLLLVAARSQAYKLMYENWKPTGNDSSAQKSDLQSKNVDKHIENQDDNEQNTSNTAMIALNKEYNDAKAKLAADREYVPGRWGYFIGFIQPLYLNISCCIFCAV